MKSALAFRVSHGVVALFSVGALASLNAFAADVTGAATSGVAQTKEAAKTVSVPAIKANTGKVATQAGTVIGKSGDNQYPTGAPIMPPKPKKDALEAAGALKAKAAP